MTRHIELICGECLVRLEAWSPDDGFDGWINVQVISNPSSRWHMLMGPRIKNAWSVLRGRYDWSGFELMTRKETEALISQLSELSTEAFPKVVTDTTIKREV